MLRYFVFLVVFYFLSVSLHADTLRPLGDGNKVSDKPLYSLTLLHWKNRVFLIRDNGESNNYEDILSTESFGVSDRDVIWFIVRENDIVSNYHGNIEDNFSAYIEDKFFSTLPESYEERDAIILVGKDGGVKFIDEELSLKTLFALIDGMPMRKSEMRQKKIH